MTVEARRVRNPAPMTAPGRGNWWVQPTSVAVGFTIFLIYSIWSVAVVGGHEHPYEFGPYLSPYYSPLLKFGWLISPAWLVAWAPAGFRATCYYYRKAYYRAFFLDPPACALAEPSFRRHYRGERGFPFILNNFHRFFLYLALVVLAVLWFDTLRAFYYHGGFYLGLGAVLMLANVILLTGYTFSCHALRHLVGGNINCFSCVRFGKARKGMWGFVSALNPYHGSWAWASLISVLAVDVYIRIFAPGFFGWSCFSGHLGC